MKPTTVLTSSGSKARATAYARHSRVCWSTGLPPAPRWVPDESGVPWPVSKYMALSPTVPRPSSRPAAAASASIGNVTPKALFAPCVPAIDWNTRSTGTPASIRPSVVVTCVSTHDWTGMS